MKVRTEFSNVWGEYKNHSNLPICKVLPYLVIIGIYKGCNNDVKFNLCQTVLSIATVSYSCGFSVDDPAIGLTLT